jgi:hypothetical protein
MNEFVKYPEPGQRYRHYKGGLYEVITMSTHSETGEKEVVYKSILFGSVMHRPLSMWFETVDGSNGYKIPRFKLAN